MSHNMHLKYKSLKAIYSHGGFLMPVSTMSPEFLGGKGSNLSVRMAGGLIWESVDKAGILFTWEVSDWLMEVLGWSVAVIHPWLCFSYAPNKFIDLAKPTGSNFDLVEGLD